MKQLKKNLLFLAVAVLLVGVSTASAQVQFFVSASGARPLRPEGTTEAVGTVSFAANSAGTIVVDSEMTLDYGTDVLNGSGNVVFSGVLCNVTLVACVEGVHFDVKTGSLASPKSTIIVKFTDIAVFTAGDSINVTAARVDANALGEGSDVGVSVTAVVPAASQATNAITIIQVGALIVGNVKTLSTKVSFKSKSFLLCDITEGSSGAQAVAVTVNEEFAAAFLSAGDEAALSPGTIVAFKIRFELENIPIGVTVVATNITSGDDATDATLGVTIAGNTFTSTAGDQDTKLDVTIPGVSGLTDTASKEQLGVLFTFTVPDEDDLQQTEGTGTLEVSLEGGDDVGEIPLFASNSQKIGDVILLQLCDCFLLYSWLPNTGDGAFDSGLTVSNTTADPPQIGTSGQSGDVTLYFWATDGTVPAASPVTLATALGAGETATGVVSTLLGEPFLGYMIARSEFQLCHGFAFINAPQPGTGGAFAQGYLPQIINNPRLDAIDADITESTGH